MQALGPMQDLHQGLDAYPGPCRYSLLHPRCYCLLQDLQAPPVPVVVGERDPDPDAGQWPAPGCWWTSSAWGHAHLHLHLVVQLVVQLAGQLAGQYLKPGIAYSDECPSGAWMH